MWRSVENIWTVQGGEAEDWGREGERHKRPNVYCIHSNTDHELNQKPWVCLLLQMHGCRREHESADMRGSPEVATSEERMTGREESAPLPPGVLELRGVVNVLDGENGWTLLRVEWGRTRGRDSVVFLPAGGTDELTGERGTSATDDLRTPVPRWAERQLGRLGTIHFRVWQLYLDGINDRAHQWKGM